MRFERFIEEISAIDLGDRDTLPPRENVKAAVEVLGRASRSPDFTMDCVARRLDSLAEVDSDEILAIWSGPEYSVHLIFWEPSEYLAAHQHHHYTVTAMLMHQLTMTTFDLAEDSTPSLRMRNRFDVFAGQSGYIYDRGVHEPWNATPRWASSIHVFSRGDKSDNFDALARTTADGRPCPQPERKKPDPVDLFVARLASADAIARARDGEFPPTAQHVVRGCAELLAAVPPSERAVALLERTFGMADVQNRRFVAERIREIDAPRGQDLLATVATLERFTAELLADRDWVQNAAQLAQ